MEENKLTKEHKEYMRKYLKRKVFIFFLYLCAAGNQCLIIMLGSILTGYDPKLCWLCILSYFLGVIALACFINLIIDYSVEQDTKDDKNRDDDKILEYAEIEKRIEDALNDKKNNK